MQKCNKPLLVDQSYEADQNEANHCDSTAKVHLDWLQK